jgi:hypothetical protein
MKEKFVAKVPETYIPHHQIPARTAWQCSFNVACWVRLLQRKHCKVCLIIKYVDQENVTKRVPVDQCTNELGTGMLLSGLTTVPAVGKIVDMGIYLETSENCPPYAVDELFVQSTDKAAVKATKLIAAI